MQLDAKLGGGTPAPNEEKRIRILTSSVSAAKKSVAFKETVPRNMLQKVVVMVVVERVAAKTRVTTR